MLGFNIVQNHNIKTNFFWYVLIGTVGIIAFSPVVFLQYPLIYDAIDVFYPGRFFTADCLKSGLLPLWNPYQHLGYPIFGDGSAGVWYPFVWLLGYLFGYDMAILHFEFILHIILAGIGMFCLLRRFRFSGPICFIFGTAYMLSGFFVGNAQHLPYVVSGTWLPFFLGSYFDVVERGKLIHALKAGFFVFLMLSGGYPPFVFILFYLVLVIFLARVVVLIRKGDLLSFFPFLRLNFLIGLSSLLFSAVVLVSFYLISDKITRTAGFSLEQAQGGAFTINSFISFLVPFATVKSPDFLGTDISMANAYIGLVPLCFLLFFPFVCKKRIHWFILVGSLFFMAASMGNALPVRELLYEYVPLMNLFRFPSVFRLFFMMGFLILAAYGFDFFLKATDTRKYMFPVLVFILLCLVGLFLFGLSQSPPDMKRFVTEELFSFNFYNVQSQHLVFHSLAQILFWILLFLIFLFFRFKHWILCIILVFSFAELIFAARLNAPYTVFYHEHPMGLVREVEKSFTAGFPIPELKPVGNFNDLMYHQGPFWHNTNTLHKTISADGFNSFQLQDFESFENLPVDLKQDILSRPVVFLAPLDPSGTVQSGDISVVGFSPQYWKVSVNSPDSALLVLQQVYFPGWNATLNGEKTEISAVYEALMGLSLPPGEHIVEFSFSEPALTWAFVVSSVSLGLFFLYSGFLFFRKNYSTASKIW